MPGRLKAVKTAKNVFELIDTIEELDQPTCTELADNVDLSVSSVYNYLRTLEDLGYLIEEDGRYRLSLKFLKKGVAVRNSYPIMHAAIEPIDILAKTIDEYLSVFVKEGDRAMMIHEANSHHAVEVPTPFLGNAFHLARSPQGKVILAHLPESRRREFLHEEEQTEGTSIEELRTELEAIRDEGLIVDDGDVHDNIWATAAPVLANGRVQGSITISTVRHRLDERRARTELPNLLSHTVNEIEHRLSRYDFDDIYISW